MSRGCTALASAAAFILQVASAEIAAAQTPNLVPRSITDITTILDQDRPDAAKIAALGADVDREPPPGASPSDLATFYLERSEARLVAGRIDDARLDAARGVAIDQSTVDARVHFDLRMQMAWLYRSSGQLVMAIRAYEELERESDRPGSKGRLFALYKHLGVCLITLGNLERAQTYVDKALALARDSKSMPPYRIYGSAWEGHAQELAGNFHRAKGQHREAEDAFRRAEEFVRKSMATYESWNRPPARVRLEFLADFLVMQQGNSKAAQGRMIEGEADVRRALLSQLKKQGKHSTGAAHMLSALGQVLAQQGRFAEAESVTRAALELYGALKLADSSPKVSENLLNLAALLNLQNRWPEAAAVYRRLDEATKDWEPRRRQRFELKPSRIYTLYKTGNERDGVAAARMFLDRLMSRFGAEHFNTALARGLLGIGLAYLNDNDAAREELKKSIAVLLATTHETDDDDAAESTHAQERIRDIVETYITLLAQLPAPDAATIGEMFRLAEAVRGSSVQKALVSASARMAVSNAAFGDLARKEQDLERQRAALLNLLNSVLALPPEERDEKVVAELRKQINVLGTARAASRKEIQKRFPRYADLINPRPPSVDEIRRALKPGEAFVSLYFGARTSFAWVAPKEGPVAFSVLHTTLDQIEDRVARIRAALEEGDVPTLAHIPHFNFEIAHGLYNLVLKPVEGALRGAKSLIVASNGALGMLPLGLLPTEPFRPAVDDTVFFASYRKAPWLARTHAVTLVPSAAAFRTLRGLAPGAPRREKFIGFGDPIFSKEQAVQQVEPIDKRGVRLARRSLPKLKGIDVAELDRLSRLPDTADELRSIAIALQLDPAKVLHLGRDANERTVKQVNLTKYRVVAFATHGLVPGELNGLTQPALALTAPDVADIDGDGLLTTDEVLALKLDADWVVLSACNTGSGVRRGAEAASGLGRAFFYAGARSLLLTNWAVYSVPAAQLVSDLIRRHVADARVARAEALRQAMLALVDGPGFLDDAGKELAAFAHPVFWAPYTLIGDGSTE